MKKPTAKKKAANRQKKLWQARLPSKKKPAGRLKQKLKKRVRRVRSARVIAIPELPPPPLQIANARFIAFCGTIKELEILNGGNKLSTEMVLIQAIQKLSNGQENTVLLLDEGGLPEYWEYYFPGLDLQKEVHKLLLAEKLRRFRYSATRTGIAAASK